MAIYSGRIAAATSLCLLLVAPGFAQSPVAVSAPGTVYQAPVPVGPGAPIPVAPNAIAPVATVAPATLTIPMGTYITVDITDRLSSDRSKPGDSVTAVLRQPIVVDGWVVARAGQPVIGRVVAAHKAGRVQGKSELAIELGELVLVDGQQVPIRTQLIQQQGNSSTGRDFAAIAATTALGALIGAGIDGGEGAAIGAGIGAGAGTAGVLATPGDPTRIRSEQVLAFRLDDPVTISTVRAQHAFLAVTPADYRTAVASTPRLRVEQQPVVYAPAPAVIYVPNRSPRRIRRY